jgi:hypothetical protein
MPTKVLQDLHTPNSLPQVQLRLSDFLNIEPEYEREASFSWDLYREWVKNEMLGKAWQHKTTKMRPALTHCSAQVTPL